MQRLNVHHLKYSLDKLCRCLDDLYNINSGGCCYIAYIIAKHLDRLGVDYSLSVYNFGGRDEFDISKEVTNMLRSNNENSVVGMHTCEHYCVFITGGGCVNKGDVSGLKQYTIEGITCRNIGWIYRHGFWNRCYNTRNNKIVKGIIDSFFKEYE